MNRCIAAAVGKEPFDLVLKNLRLVNVHTGEIYPAEIGIVQDRIAHVTPPDQGGLEGRATRDCAGLFALPGLIDTHAHIESGMLTPAHFARAVVPRGTTTILADPHEFCNVLGLEGLTYLRDASRGIGLRVLLAAPSCVPSLVGKETVHSVFGPEEIRAMLALPETVSLGEVMDYLGVINQSPRMMAILAAARASGKLVQGHVIGVTPRQLSAYMDAGVASDHETRTIEEAIVKLRSGMVLECRYASTAKNVPVEAEALRMLGYPVNATLCTDDREPHDLLEHGHLDAAVRAAIANRVPPVVAIQMATRNAALFLGLRDRGGIAPGCLADIVLASGLDDFTVRDVYVGGVLLSENGRMIASGHPPEHEVEKRNTMRVKPGFDAASFTIPAAGREARLNCISFDGTDPFSTHLVKTVFPVRDGRAVVEAREDYVAMAVLERHHASGNIAVAPVRNTGLRRGAVAGTVAHDAHNLFVFGRDPGDMLVAARRLVELGGGFAVAVDGNIAAEVPLPVAGLVSRLGLHEVAAEMSRLKSALNRLGIAGEDPMHRLTWFCLAVLPEIRLTDMGLLDTVGQKFLPALAE